MGTEKLELLVEGGKAAADQNTAQKLGPLGILQSVIKSVNDKTASFAGMKVPVKISIDTATKEFTIDIGTPPIAELIKKELNIQKGSGTPDKQKIGNLSIESIIKIAKMKKDTMHANTLKSAVKSATGSANSLGVLVEGKQAKEICEMIDKGFFDEQIQEEQTITPESKKQTLKSQLDEYNQIMKKELEKMKAAAAVQEKPKAAEEKAAVPGEEKVATAKPAKEEKKPGKK
ncbi:50S ribosomal protein L11 [Candidatus Woesearchaeota archaeon]|nr:50S ribosomal protein L11 [Candidatus Woesearchaeota archaeon]